MYGFDNIIVFGMNVMELLQKVVIRFGEYGLDMEKKDILIDMINICNQYLKFDVKSYFSRSFLCSDYCIMFVLSDLIDICFFSNCDYDYLDICLNCVLIYKFIEGINEVIKIVRILFEDLMEELQYEIIMVIKVIKDWKVYFFRIVY